ncbi:hypothetical protein NPIL_343391, partial [Nephila pilipes]
MDNAENYRYLQRSVSGESVRFFSYNSSGRLRRIGTYALSPTTVAVGAGQFMDGVSRAAGTSPVS